MVRKAEGHEESERGYKGFSVSEGGVVQEIKIRKRPKKSVAPDGGAVKISTIDYIGIAADEPLRIERHKNKPEIEMPLVEAGWTEPMCREWCEENGLLSPLYSTSARGGCWFCHYQGIDQLRILRKDYPDLWQLLLRWDSDSPVTFHADGRTVHDFERRFQMEEEGFFNFGKFGWKSLESAQMNIDQFL